MSEKRYVSVGFFIRRSIKNPDAVRGKTFAAYAHELFDTRDKAQVAFDYIIARYGLDPLFTYSIDEAFMRLEGEE